MKPRRIERLQEFLKERIAEIVQREISDPRLGMVTITKVELDRELELAKAFWSVLGDDQQQRLSAKALEHATGYVRRAMAGSLQTRTVPRLRFVFDESIAGAVRLNAKIKQLAAEAREHEAEMGEREASEASEASEAENGQVGER